MTVPVERVPSEGAESGVTKKVTKKVTSLPQWIKILFWILVGVGLGALIF